MTRRRGQIRQTTRAEAIERALSMRTKNLAPPPDSPPDAKHQPLQYRLKAGYNGGADPYASHPGSPSYGNRAWTADCVGFVCWAIGLDRYQPGFFKSRAGYINCDSAIIDGEKDGYFRIVDKPIPGDLVVFGGKYAFGVRLKPGHIGIVTFVPEEWDGKFESLRVVHCSPGNKPTAVAETNGKAWRQRGAFLRYLKFDGEVS